MSLVVSSNVLTSIVAPAPDIDRVVAVPESNPPPKENVLSCLKKSLAPIVIPLVLSMVIDPAVRSKVSTSISMVAPSKSIKFVPVPTLNST